MRRVLAVLLVTSGFAVCALGQEEGSGGPPTPVPADVKARLTKLLPDAKDGGVVPTAAVQFYTSNLYEYMDGGAEPFHTYGMVALAHREYKGEGAEITADVFDMGDPLKAFGMYAAERSPDYHFIPVGAEGYISEMALNFLQERFYVKLAAFGDNARIAKALTEFAQALSGRIGTEKSMPSIVRVLPKQNLVARSESYVVKAPLGHDFLAPAVRATYSIGGKQTSLLISLGKDEKDAAQKAQRLEARFKRSGKLAPVEALGPGFMRGSNQYEGDVIFFARGRYAVLCVHPPAQPEAFVKAVADAVAAEPGTLR